jgi:hypothetical protein
MYSPFKDFDVRDFLFCKISLLAEKNTAFIFGQIFAT